MKVNFAKVSGIFFLAMVLSIGNPTDPAIAYAQEGGTILPDARPLPAHIQELKAESVTAAGVGVSDAPGHYDTSVFMAGSVAVGIILPESTGSGENWTTTEKNTVVQEIKDGMSWWVTKGGTLANLSFQYDVQAGIPSSYEPITLSTSSEGSWIGETMSNLGYSAGDYFERVYAYTNHIRDQYNTEWAFTIFVVDSSTDVDGKFSDGYFAYAYLSGPFMIMTYDNDGWGISNMNMVATHETGHIFLAGDQYYQAGYGGCTSLTEKFGYLGVQNSNCEYNNPSSVPSIMRHNEDAVDTTARGQIGWRDSDSDGKPDPMDTIPVVSLAAHSPDPTSETSWSYSGYAEVPPHTHAICNGAGDRCYNRDVTIQTISQIQYRVDAGVWTNVIASDGALNSDIENFSFSVSGLGAGTHTIQVQATASSGNMSSVWEDSVTVAIALSSAMLVSPTGNIGTNYTPNFVWNDVTSVTYYELYIQGPSGKVLDQWYQTSAICSSGTCTVPNPVTLSGGNHTWWVQTWNSAGYGSWSSGMNFNTTIPTTPGAAILVSPTGDISTNYAPIYRWNEVNNATWYYLYVNGPSGNMIKQWYQTSAVCSGGTCSVTPATTLGGGVYTWWIQTWNSIGYGPWSTGMNFSTTIPTVPAAAALVSPSGDISTNYAPIYRWNEVNNATWYYLYVNGPSGNMIKQWYQTSAVCSGGTCSVTPATTLGGGAHIWWIQTWNNVGYGAWSSGMNFTTTTPTVPGAAALVLPTGDIGTSYSPSYRWNEVNNTTWYELYVNGPSGKVFDQWYQASAVCSGGTCSVTPPTILGIGAHTWWLRTWNNVGYGPWSSGMNFSVTSPTSSSPTIAGCPVFPSNNVWNVPINTLPVHTRSSQWINTIGATTGFHMDFGSGTWAGGPIGIPYNITNNLTPQYNLSFYYPGESDAGPYPIPESAVIEYGSDHHLLAVDSSTCTLYEIYDISQNVGGLWSGGSGAIWNLNSNILRTDGWTSADAAGLPILPGLVRYEEVQAGEINHAIRFTAESTNGYIWPARHLTSNTADTTIPPMGARFRLKASYNISGFPADIQVVLRAMKTYGIILADNGSNWYVSGMPSESWGNDNLHLLDVLTGNDFEAVDASSLMVESNSGATP